MSAPLKVFQILLQLIPQQSITAALQLAIAGERSASYMSVPANVDVILQGSAICASNPAIFDHTFNCVAEALRQRCVLIFGGTKLCPVPPGGMRTDHRQGLHGNL